jgi:hypothetical protein
MSDMTISAVMRRMNADRPEDAPAPWRDGDGREAVPHGFRATFSTWVDDTRPDEREAAEKALAHEAGSKVSAAYRRSDLFDRRIRLMQAWAAWVTQGGARRRAPAPRPRVTRQRTGDPSLVAQFEDGWRADPRHRDHDPELAREHRPRRRRRERELRHRLFRHRFVRRHRNDVAGRGGDRAERG